MRKDRSAVALYIPLCESCNLWIPKRLTLRDCELLQISAFALLHFTLALSSASDYIDSISTTSLVSHKVIRVNPGDQRWEKVSFWPLFLASFPLSSWSNAWCTLWQMQCIICSEWEHTSCVDHNCWTESFRSKSGNRTLSIWTTYVVASLNWRRRNPLSYSLLRFLIALEANADFPLEISSAEPFATTTACRGWVVDVEGKSESDERSIREAL